MESMEDTVYVYTVNRTGHLHNGTGSYIIFTSDCLFARCSCIFERSEKCFYCYMWFNMTFCFRIFRTSLLSLSFLPLANSATHLLNFTQALRISAEAKHAVLYAPPTTSVFFVLDGEAAEWIPKYSVYLLSFFNIQMKLPIWSPFYSIKW